MRTLLLVFGIAASTCLAAAAQVVNTFVVNTWEVPVRVIPPEEQTRFPDFRDGLVYYLNGKTEVLRMNYSMLYGEMQFIGPAGDTLALAREAPVRKVVIDQTTFYALHGEGFAEVLTATAPLTLARRQSLGIVWGEHLQYAEYRPDNTYGGPGPTLKQFYHRKTEGLLKVGKFVSYVFMDRNQRFYPAKKAVLLELFPARRREITRYLKANAIDFKEQEDLEQLIQFCSSMAGK